LHEEDAMAETKQKTFVEKLADAGEEAIQRIGNAPGGDRVAGVLTSVRDRLDDLQRRVRGLEKLEQRVSALEARVDKLDGKSKAAARKPAAKSSAADSTSSSA
jgi:hypothetical protein